MNITKTVLNMSSKMSQPKTTHDEQVCMPPALWKLWQFQRNPEAKARVLATEESLELQATSTVPANLEELSFPQWLPSRHVVFFGLLASPGVPAVLHTLRTMVRNLTCDLDDSSEQSETPHCERPVVRWSPFAEFSHS